MSEYTTHARPYAKAAFEVAQSESKGAESKQAEWSDALHLIEAVVSNDDFAAVIDNPAMGADAKGEILIDICGDKRAEAENTVEATATSAYALSDAQVQSMTDALKKKLGREVNLTTEIDQSLIGGVVIRAGDLVIDGSTQAKIGSLTHAVSH